MTSGLLPACRLIVVGVDLQDAQVAALPLGHGQDPAELLALHGWQVLQVRDVVRHPVDKLVMTMAFVVEPTPAQSRPVTALTTGVRAGPKTDPAGQATVEGEAVFRHQRVAAYAVVSSSRGFLMTQFSERTGAPGLWGLPGGGLEAEETPAGAVVREVWEESGQLVEVGELALVASSRWVGRAPNGRLEDYHAVRVVYRARCPEPSDPVVHDVGGTTQSAAWFMQADLDLLALTSGWRSILRDMTGSGGGAAQVSDPVMAADETDGPDHDHDDTDADDRARP